MERSQFQRFLECSLDVLSAEKPAAYARLCDLLRGWELAFEIDGVAVGMRFEPFPVVRTGHGESAEILVRSSRQTILDVVAGETTLEEAVLGDRLQLYGSVESLVRFHDALRVYLHGAVRAPGFPRLRDAYVGSTPAPDAFHGGQTT